MRPSENNRFESLKRVVPRSTVDALKAFLVAGIPTSLVLAVFCSPDQEDVRRTNSRQFHDSTRAQVSVILENEPVSPRGQVVLGQGVTTSSVPASPSPAQVNPFQVQGAGEQSTTSTQEAPAPSLTTVEGILRQFNESRYDADQITILLDRLSFEVVASRVSPEQLKEVLSRVLLEIETSRGKWKSDAETGLVLQGVRNVLSHAYEVKDGGQIQPLQNPPALSEQDFRDLDERVERDRRNHLAALAQSRVQELLGLVKNDHGSRYDAVIGSFLLADSSNLISLLRTNGSTSEFIAAKSSVMRLLQDMIADYRFRTGQEDQVKRLEAFLNEIQAIV